MVLPVMRHSLVESDTEQSRDTSVLHEGSIWMPTQSCWAYSLAHGGRKTQLVVGNLEASGGPTLWDHQ
jgi:hypothetical protein